jgi:Fur family ferric uptake transcriptional regulator
MPYKKEQEVFEDYIRSKGLKHTGQRMEILENFLKTERHLTADELYRMVTKKNPSIGYATIYRTVKLLCECGLCRELRLEDGITRYEHLYGHEHHDHLICVNCGTFIEVMDPEIEKLQERLAKQKGFILKRYRLEMYGICKGCRKQDVEQF